MKAECTLVQQDWDGMIPALLARKYDAIVASMSITEERKQKVDFTDKYYYDPGPLRRQEGVHRRHLARGLKGKKVGVQRETIHDRYATENSATRAEIVRYGTQDEANLDLVAGRVDVLLADSLALKRGLPRSTERGKDFEFVGPAITDPQVVRPGRRHRASASRTATCARS